MSVEKNGGVPICPYWRQYITLGQHTLALCGAVSPNEQPLPTHEAPRLSTCPYFPSALEVAFKHPSIVEYPLDWEWKNPSGEIVRTVDIILEAQSEGQDGIDQLQGVWDQEVEKFIQRHSK